MSEEQRADISKDIQEELQELPRRTRITARRAEERRPSSYYRFGLGYFYCFGWL